jgi:hypothetical protein
MGQLISYAAVYASIYLSIYLNIYLSIYVALQCFILNLADFSVY